MRTSSFNVVHLGVGILIVVVLLAILMPMVGLLNREKRISYEQAQLRGIYIGMVTHANSNRNWYAGLDSQGNYVDGSVAAWQGVDGRTLPARQVGIAVEDRFAILLTGEFFTPEYIVSPYETDISIHVKSGGGLVTPKHYSYAMLQVPKSGPRRYQWRQTLNGQAIIFSDRNTGSTIQTGSIRNDKESVVPWRGFVYWNDNHSGFESDPVVDSQFGDTIIRNDHLFQSDGDDDAYLIHEGN